MNYDKSLLKKKESKQAKAELAKRELASRYLLDFILYNFPSYRVNWHHNIIIEKLEALERGEIKKVMFLMPPRHGKSEICSKQFPAWYIGRNPTKEIITSSYSSGLAVDFGRKSRNLVNSEDFTNVFEGVKLAEDSKSVGKWHTNQEGSYIAVGVGGAITGKGADVLIIDDPIKNREDADSSILRNNIWEWYRSTALTRLSPNGAIILIQTRWHDDDLAGRLLESEKKEWVVVDFPAIANEDEKFRKQGEALWENQYSLEKLLEIKNSIGSYNWSSLYQQNPIDEETQEFKKKYFHKRTLKDLAALNTRNFLTIDTAVSQAASGDWTGIVRNYVDDQNKWNLKASKTKKNPTELINTIFNLHLEDNYERIGIEKTIYLQALMPFLNDEMRKRNVFLPIVELQHHQTAKETRIRGLIPRYEGGSVFHIEGECNDLEDELLRFPKSKHDDVMDACAYQLQLAEAPFAKNKKTKQPVWERINEMDIEG